MAGRVKRAAQAIVLALVCLAIFIGCTAALDIRGLVASRANPLPPGEWQGTKTIASGANYAASLAVNGDILYVLYYDSVNRKLRIVKSPDRGATWGIPFTVDTTTDFYTLSNNLVVDGSNLYVSYQRSNEVYFLQLTDTGSAFSASNAKTISTLSAYPYGYENSITFDNANVYIAYSAGGGPAFSYASKGASMTFSSPSYIDSALNNNSGNGKMTSIYLGQSGNLSVTYFDDVSNIFKLASFAPGAALPMTVTQLGPTAITAADYPSIGTANGSPQFVSYYDTSALMLKLYEHFSYSFPPLMIGFVGKSVVVDSSSADVGKNCKLLFNVSDNTLKFAYLDSTNKQLKFANGVKHPNNPPSVPPDYSFSTQAVDSVGGVNFDCSLGSDGTRFYIVYYDSTGSGALKLAKSLDGGTTW